MKFKVEIKNVGKLTDAKTRFAGFTVFAGPNNTGKSFVSKFLYSLFDAMNANHAEVHADHLVMPVRRSLFGLDWRANPEDGGPLASLLGRLEDEVDVLKSLVKGIGDAETLRAIYPRLKIQVEKMLETAVKIRQLPEKTVASRGRLKEGSNYGDIGTRTDRWHLHKHVTELKDVLSRMDEKEFIVAGIRYKIRQNLIQNFQVPGLSDLRGDQTDFVSKCIRDENKLKVYGSLLVLCHLATACREVKKFLKAKKYRFWLVVSGMNTAEEKKVFDNLKDRLSQELKSVLTGKVLDDVEIIPSNALVSKLSKQASTP